MPYTKKFLPESQLEFTITVTPNEYQKHLEKAADRISERVAIKGFRPGHAPYEIIKRETGEMAILEEALNPIVMATFHDAVSVEEVETIGMPKISVEKLAPDNDIVYTATVALLPKVRVGDIRKISVEKIVKPVEEKQIADMLDAIRGMHAVETIKTGPAGATDKVVLDMNMFLDKVPVEGGQAKNYQVYLSEPHYIPGFNEQIAGLKKDDEKTFALDFPPMHYQKHLAGKKVNIAVKVKDVYERTLPELSDELAKKLGQKSVEKLRELVAGNLREEAEQKADRAYDVTIWEAVIGASTFDPIPEVLLDAERQKMMFELKRDLDRHGISLEQYLEDLKKKEEDVYNDFKVEAEKRAKAALLSRQIAKEQNLAPTPEEIEKELALMRDAYKNDKEYLERLNLSEVRDTIATMVQNKKVIAWLRESIQRK